MHCGKTANRIRMPFGIIGWTGPGMRHVVRFRDRSTRRSIFGANLGRAIVTNGSFTAYICDSAATPPSSQITMGRLVIHRYYCKLFSGVCAIDIMFILLHIEVVKSFGWISTYILSPVEDVLVPANTFLTFINCYFPL